jgi:hypothetical protein
MGEKLKDEPIELYEGIIISVDNLTDTTESDNDGKYSFNLRFNKKGTFDYTVNHPETGYCNNDVNVLFTVEDMPTTLKAKITEPEILIGDILPVEYTLKDYYDLDVETGLLKLYEDNILAETVNIYEDFTYIPPLGNHTYKVVFEGDSYVASTVDGLKCNVRKYHTSMILLSDTSRYKVGDTVTVHGTLIDEINRPISDAPIKLYDGDVLLSQSYSREDGTVTFDIDNISEGKHYLKLNYDGNAIYDDCISNIFRIRVRSDEPADINLYLYPESKILEADTRNIPCSVYACDRNGNPISTSFHMWTTYDGELSNSYNTNNDGWCNFILNTDAIHNCHGTVIQAISTIDEDVYSNIVFIRDYVNHPLPITDYGIVSEKSSYSYKDEVINISGYLIDIEESPLPHEELTISLYDGNTLIEKKNTITNVKGEFQSSLKNNGVRLDTLTAKLKYDGNTRYSSVSDEINIVFYPPRTTIDTYDVLTIYKDIATFNVPLNVIDEFNNPAIDGGIALTFESNEYTGTIVDGYYSFNNLNVPEAGEYPLLLEYDGNSYYEDSTKTFNLNVLKLDTSLNDITVPEIVYGDEFTITGVLNNIIRNTPVKNAQIKLYVDNTEVKTTTTNNNGVFNVKHTINDSSGPHTLQLLYNGDNVFKPSQSSTINVDVKRETSVLTLINPRSTYFIGKTYDLDGTLLTDDNEAIEEPVKLYVNNVLRQTVTPDNEGAFTFTYINELPIGEYTIRVVHDQSRNYTAAEYVFNCKVKEELIELYAYIDSMDGTGIVNYGEEFIVTVVDSEFEETNLHSSLFSNLIFELYDKNNNLVNIDYEDNIFLDSRVYTVQYGSENLLLPGNYSIKIISPASETYDYKEVILTFNIKDNLVLYAYDAGENYTSDIYEGDEFIVTVLDDYFGEGLDIYTDVYENLEITIYDSDENVINLPYEKNIYKDCTIYTMLYGATNDLPAGEYNILIVSPETTAHERKQVTLNITIKER